MRFLIALFALPILAHTLYLLPARFRVAVGEKVVFSIHNGDSFPASEDLVSPERIAEARLVSGAGSAVLTDFRALGRALHGVVAVEQAGTNWLVVRTKPNLLSLDPAKFEQYLNDEGLESIIAWRKEHGESAKASRERYSKYAKSLVVCDKPSDSWKKVIGLAIEFVPDADPAALKPGDSLPVKLLWRGKPAAGLRVEKAWATKEKNGVEVVGRTDDQGRIGVPVERAARWRLHAVAMERTSGDADWESFWATMTFEVN
jgi:hypothetical protein